MASLPVRARRLPVARSAAIVAVLTTASACARSAAAPPPGQARAAEYVAAGALHRGPLDITRPLSADERAWVDRTLASLTLRDRVAQLVTVWVLGDYTNVADTSYQQVRRWIERDHVGGVVMSLGSPLETAAKVNAMQELALTLPARIPLLVSSDVEPGLGRLEGGVFLPQLWSAGTATVLPTNMAIGAGGSTADAEAAGRITGREARAIGIHVAFAPVVDVNNNPANPVINVRSFGEDPERVAALSVAFVRGVQAEGVAAVAKHFPGHGDTDTDSHSALPVVRSDRARLNAVELVPFRAAIAAGVAGMMTAHIALPAVEGDSTPATLAPRVMTGLLRDSLGFRGITFTDAMTMDGIGKGYTIDRSGPLAVEAGDDVLLMPTDVPRMLDAIVARVEGGTIARSRIDASVRRVLELKVRTGAVARPIVSLDSLREVVGAPTHWSAARDIAARAVTLLRDGGALVPFGAGRTITAVVYAPDAEVATGAGFIGELRAGARALREFRISPRTAASALDSIATAAAASDRIVVMTYTRTFEGAGRLAIPAHVATWIDGLASTGKLVVVAGGNPYVIRQFPKVGSYLVTYGRGDALERAAARAVLGHAPISGRAPITLPGFFARGDGLRRGDAATTPATPPPAPATSATLAPATLRRLQDTVRRVLDVARADSTFPGAYAVVGTRSGILAEYGVGRIDWSATAPAPNAHTLWDLASLTKVAATTSAMMQLVEQGRVALDAPVQRYLPEWAGRGKERVTIRHLITHSSGLPPFKVFPMDIGADSTRALFLAVALDTVPGVRMAYSDIGFVLLGFVAERVSGEPLDAYVVRHVYAPLGMNETFFRPNPSLLPRIAPTEHQPFRGGLVRGVVHDERAWRLGGVAGHAGLFSSAADLSRLARAYLNGGTLDGRRVWAESTVTRFTSYGDSTFSNRGLGWQKPDRPGMRFSGPSAAWSGGVATSRAFGHTGFTGTSIYVDPARDLFVILLSNRVNPTRDNPRITAVRTRLTDAVAAVLSDAPSPSSAASRR